MDLLERIHISILDTELAFRVGRIRGLPRAPGLKGVLSFKNKGHVQLLLFATFFYLSYIEKFVQTIYFKC